MGCPEASLLGLRHPDWAQGRRSSQGAQRVAELLVGVKPVNGDWEEPQAATWSRCPWLGFWTHLDLGSRPRLGPSDLQACTPHRLGQ